MLQLFVRIFPVADVGVDAQDAHQFPLGVVQRHLRGREPDEISFAVPRRLLLIENRLVIPYHSRLVLVIDLRHFYREKIPRRPALHLAGILHFQVAAVRRVIEYVALLQILHVNAVGNRLDENPQQLPLLRQRLLRLAPRWHVAHYHPCRHEQNKNRARSSDDDHKRRRLPDVIERVDPLLQKPPLLAVEFRHQIPDVRHHFAALALRKQLRGLFPAAFLPRVDVGLHERVLALDQRRQLVQTPLVVGILQGERSQFFQIIIDQSPRRIVHRQLSQFLQMPVDQHRLRRIVQQVNRIARDDVAALPTLCLHQVPQ